VSIYTVSHVRLISGLEWAVEVQVTDASEPVVVHRFATEDDAQRWADRLNLIETNGSVTRPVRDY
jgi:hypothetical protein